MALRLSTMMLCSLALASLVLGQDLVTNGSFEDPVEGPATTIANWGRWQSSAQTAYRVTEPTTDGKWALFIRMEFGKGIQVVQHRMKEYQPGQLYEIVFEARSAEPYDSLVVDILDQDPSMAGKPPILSQAYTNLDWTRYSVRFKAPKDAGHPLLIRFYPRGPKEDSAVYLDDVHVFPVSDAAVTFTATYERVELDTFNAINTLNFDLDTQLDAAKWRLDDFGSYKTVSQDKLTPLREQAGALKARLEAQTKQLEAFRQDNLFPGIVLSSLPDAEIAEKTQQLDNLVTDLGGAIDTARGELGPQIASLRRQVDALAPGWEFPVERTAVYNPRMLNDRFHRIISYHGYMSASEYLWRAMWELKPTAIHGYQHRENRRENRAEFLRLNRPRTMPYIESVKYTGFPMDLTETKASIDSVLEELGDDPAFAGIEMDEPGINDKHVTTPEGYAEFRKWLAGRYPNAVGGFPIADALTWELPEKIETDFDGVMWMELQQFKTYWFAHQLKQIQDYLYSKNQNCVFTAVIQQYLPMQPQYCSYVTTPAALDWISMDPYNSANVGEALLMDLLRSNSRGPNLLVVGTCYDRTSGRFAKDMAISFAHCGGVWDWCWVYMAKHRAPAGVTTGAWPVKYRGYWKEGMYESAQDIMGKMAVIEPYLVHTDTGANVGLVYSERSGIYFSRPGIPNNYYAANLGIYQGLQQLQVPVEALLAESMTPEKLAKFKVLVLADAECLAAAEVDLLTAWVRQGGSLIAAGGVGVRDQWGREHEGYGDLSGVFGVTRGERKEGAKAWKLDDGAETRMNEKWPYDVVTPAADTAQAVGTFDNGDLAVVCNDFGKGAAYLLTAHNLGMSFDGSSYVKGMYKRYWPGFKDNLRKLVLDAVRHAEGRLPVRAENAPENVEVGLRKQGDRLVVHLLNYDDDGPVSGMKLIADGRGEQKAFYPVDGEAINTTKRGRDLEIPVRDFEHHCCIVIEPR